jgi:hypothetical protein
LTSFQPHLEILPAPQRAIWPLLAASIERGLVLYGGTAVALRLGHRTSVDFDFFTEKPIDIDELKDTFGFLETSKVIQSQIDILTVLVPVHESSVKISFFGSITIGRAGAPSHTNDGVLEVASLLDLLATKVKVVQQRIEAKDYQDVAAILRSGIKLEDGLAAATVMYSPAFQPSEAIKALTYFEGGDLDRLQVADKGRLVHAASAVRRIPVVGLASRRLSSEDGDLIAT